MSFELRVFCGRWTKTAATEAYGLDIGLALLFGLKFLDFIFNIKEMPNMIPMMLFSYKVFF